MKLFPFLGAKSKEPGDNLNASPGRRRQEKNNEEPPPVLKSWRNLYLLVLGNLLLWIALFTLFTWMFR